MKTIKLLLAIPLVFASMSSFAGINENKKYVIKELSVAQEMELLSGYICEDSSEMESVKIEIYNAKFELVETGEISLEVENAHLDFMISQSHLLIDNGLVRIYQIQ